MKKFSFKFVALVLLNLWFRENIQQITFQPDNVCHEIPTLQYGTIWLHQKHHQVVIITAMRSMVQIIFELSFVRTRELL